MIRLPIPNVPQLTLLLFREDLVVGYRIVAQVVNGNNLPAVIYHFHLGSGCFTPSLEFSDPTHPDYQQARSISDTWLEEQVWKNRRQLIYGR